MATQFQPATADLLVNNWFGHVTSNTTWGPGAYAITGDVTVDAGKTLTIAPGTTIYFQKNEDNQASGLDVDRSELIVADGGTLVAIGSSGSPIKFLSSSSNPFFDEWYGIRVYGSAKLKNCWIKNAYAGIDFQNTAYDTVRACVFQNNEYFGLQARNSNVYIVQDTFKNNGMGVCFDPASAVIESCYFKDNFTGIYTLRSFGRISHNRIIGSCYLSGSGLQAEGYVAGANQFLRFNNNAVSGQFLQGGVIANARVRVDSCKVNINKQVCPPVPEDPPLNRALQAFSVDSAISRFSILSVAGYTSGTIPPVVEIGPSTPANLGCVGTADSGYNTILRSGSGKAVVNFGSAADSAQKNYWGTASPTTALFTGPVNFIPYLTSQPSPPIAPRVIDQDKSGNTPLRYSLMQNYPNPFNPTTTIRFSLPQAGRATLTVYNLLGQQVAKLWEGEKPAGVHTFVWDGRDEKGSVISSGIYFYKLEATGFKEVKRMVFLK